MRAPTTLAARLFASSNLYAAGGLVSTADGLAAFMLALQKGELVSPASLKRVNAGDVLADGRQLFGHGGYIFGSDSQLGMDIDSGNCRGDAA